MRPRHCAEGRCGNGYRTRAAVREDWKWFTCWRWKGFWRAMRAVVSPSCREAGRSDGGVTGSNFCRKMIEKAVFALYSPLKVRVQFRVQALACRDRTAARRLNLNFASGSIRHREP